MLPSSLSGVRRLLDDRRALRVRRITGSWIYALIRTVFLLGFAFIILYPVIIMISKAFMLQIDIYDNAVLWIPKHFTLSNIKYAIERMDYWRSLLVTAIVCGTVTVVQVFICMMVGYGFARFEFPAKKLLFVLAVLTIVVPPQTMMIPQFFNFKYFDILGLIRLITGRPGVDMMNSYLPYYILAVTGQGLRNGLFIFLFRQSFRGMPKETEEAAMVDGSGDLGTFLRIMLPSATTLILTVALFSFVWQWNDTFYADLFVPTGHLLASRYAIYEYGLGTLGTNSETVGSVIFNMGDSRVLTLLKNGGVFLLMVPLMILYVFLQRFFVEGIDRTGLVG